MLNNQPSISLEELNKVMHALTEVLSLMSEKDFEYHHEMLCRPWQGDAAVLKKYSLSEIFAIVTIMSLRREMLDVI